MNRSGEMSSAASASTKSLTMSSTKAFGSRPWSAALWAMFTECSSVPVRKRVSSPFIRCQRAMTSAPITSYRVCRPGLLFG
jgi:hypothetical protein